MLKFKTDFLIFEILRRKTHDGNFQIMKFADNDPLFIHLYSVFVSS